MKIEHAMARGAKRRARKSLAKKHGKGKMAKVMHEWKHGTLHSGSKHGPKVTNRKQAIAIGLSEQRKAARGGY